VTSRDQSTRLLGPISILILYISVYKIFDWKRRINKEVNKEGKNVINSFHARNYISM